MSTAGFDIKPGEHPIVPVMLYAAALAEFGLLSECRVRQLMQSVA